MGIETAIAHKVQQKFSNEGKHLEAKLVETVATAGLWFGTRYAQSYPDLAEEGSEICGQRGEGPDTEEHNLLRCPA